MLPFIIFQLLRIFKEGKSFAERGTEILLKGLLHDSRAVGMFVLSVVTDNNSQFFLWVCLNFFLSATLYVKKKNQISPHFKVVFNQFNIVLFKL